MAIAADIVLRIRPEAYEASFESLTNDIARAVVQLQRWQDPVAIPVSSAVVSVQRSLDTP